MYSFEGQNSTTGCVEQCHQLWQQKLRHRQWALLLAKKPAAVSLRMWEGIKLVYFLAFFFSRNYKVHPCHYYQLSVLLLPLHGQGTWFQAAVKLFFQFTNLRRYKASIFFRDFFSWLETPSMSLATSCCFASSFAWPRNLIPSSKKVFFPVQQERELSHVKTDRGCLEGLDGGASKTLNTKIFPSITSWNS